MEELSTASTIALILGGLFTLAVILTALGHLLQWIAEIIEELGYALAVGIGKLLSFPFLLPYRLYMRRRAKKIIAIPAPPPPEQTVVRRRIITATLTEVHIDERR